MTFEDDLRAKLAGDIDVTTWRDLRPHAGRDRVILVNPPLALLDAAVAVAVDHADRVQGWVTAGSLTRPTAEQLAAWERDLDIPFDCVVVSPFVLAVLRLDA